MAMQTHRAFPLGRRLRQICHRIDKAERAGWIARIEAACDNRAGPSAYPGKYRDILFAVRTLITNRLTDNS